MVTMQIFAGAGGDCCDSFVDWNHDALTIASGLSDDSELWRAMGSMLAKACFFRLHHALSSFESREFASLTMFPTSFDGRGPSGVTPDALSRRTIEFVAFFRQFLPAPSPRLVHHGATPEA